MAGHAAQDDFLSVDEIAHVVADHDGAETDQVRRHVEQNVVRVEQLHRQIVEVGKFRRPQLRRGHHGREQHIGHAGGHGIGEGAAQLDIVGAGHAGNENAVVGDATEKDIDVDLPAGLRIHRQPVNIGLRLGHQIDRPENAAEIPIIPLPLRLVDGSIGRPLADDHVQSVCVCAGHDVRRDVIAEFIKTALMHRAGGMAVDDGRRVSQHAFKDQKNPLAGPAGRHRENDVGIKAHGRGCGAVPIAIGAKAFRLPAGRHRDGGQDIVAATAAGHVKRPRHGVILVRAG